MYAQTRVVWAWSQAKRGVEGEQLLMLMSTIYRRHNHITRTTIRPHWANTFSA